VPVASVAGSRVRVDVRDVCEPVDPHADSTIAGIGASIDRATAYLAVSAR
jgi:hypothetical protein